MSTRYITQTKITADPPQVWQAITQCDFVKNYLPEIKRDFNNLKPTAPLYRHKNLDKLLPAYVVQGKAISWDSNANTTIKLTRSDLNANIRSVDIDITAADGYTNVNIEVNYKPKLDKNFFLTHASVHNLFNHKLQVLKQDIESKTTLGALASYS